MTQLVQILLTPEQAALLGAAADVTVRAHEEDTLVILKEDEEATLKQLSVFMGQVALSPSSFPVTGRLAATIKKRRRELKGDAQPTSRKNKRKERQERRMRTHKARRSQRRAMAEEYNKARAITEAEIAEMQAIQDERMAEIESETKYTITDIMGNVLIDDVPESMIVAKVEQFEPEIDFEQAANDMPEKLAPKIILPSSAEALGLTLNSDDPALD